MTAGVDGSVGGRELDRAARRDKALRRAAAVGAGARLVTMALGLLTVSILVRSLSGAESGIALTLGTLTALLGFADLGIGQGLLTRLAIAHGQDDILAMRALVSSAWATLLAVGTAAAGVGITLTYVLPWQSLLGASATSARDIRSAVLVFFAGSAAAIPAGIGQRILTGLQRGAEVSVWQIASSLAVLAGVSLAAATHQRLWMFVFSTICGATAVSALQTAFVLGGMRSTLRPQRKLITRVQIRELASTSGLFFVLSIAVAAAYQTDTVVVSAVLGASSALVFGIALRMFATCTALFSGLTQQLWPALAEALARGDTRWVRRRFFGVLRTTSLVMTGMVLLLIIFGQQLARVWVGGDHVPPLSLLVPFAIWTIYGLAMTQCSYLLNAANVVKPQIAMAIAMATANLPISILLTQHLGFSGPIYGSLISHLIFAGAPTVVLVRRVLAGVS